MTAQIGDKYTYREREFTVVATSSPMLFDPANFGLETHVAITACWRGYWCAYAIENDALILKDLYLFNADNKYPPFYGVEVSPEEFKEHEYYSAKDGKTKKGISPMYFGHRVYKNVNMPIPYTGRILLGDELMNEYYIHMGFQRSWAYKKLIELIFEDGVLQKCEDFSHIAKEQREAIKQGSMSPLQPCIRDMPEFIDSFSLSYADKAWWIK